MNLKYEWRFLFFLLMLVFSVFCGYTVQYSGFFLQSILMAMIVITNIDILLLTIRNFISRYYIVMWFFLSTLLLSSLTSLDILLHIKESLRFILVLLVCLIVSFYADKFPATLAKASIFLVLLITFLSLSAYVGVNAYPIVGERFGFPRPFLFANPITISILIGTLLCYVLSQYKLYIFKLISFIGIFSFWSYTGIVVYFIVRHKIMLALMICLIGLFVLSSIEVGSFLIRMKLIVNAVESLYHLDFEHLLFGLGFRNLDLWNAQHAYLLMTTDITFFLRVLYEFGLFGFVSFILIIARIFVRDSTLGLVFIFIFLSIDQVAHFWVLPFVILLSKERMFNTSKVGFPVKHSVKCN